ncbi:hypothetical protein DI09_133p20 [Mitosporidium daphniae]|uniref:Uncharacterized protein n=1 Tax=Mitosporidium daphniae TaxID=1485682 RepID=A0A098VYF7_9MICR|nr:uncharacterized protein DI09_133p20 [Mitosporidium daphniae]KGG52801.1 hypothetical protein DI09_133p20 [Mitosporidium daphniae]|eukprot:XP_013239237.1 uncharacterized protein DI09_133p20 [Mitosporidium daphniae]
MESLILKIRVGSETSKPCVRKQDTLQRMCKKFRFSEAQKQFRETPDIVQKKGKNIEIAW